jgi:CheY-like chemotaxis protein
MSSQCRNDKYTYCGLSSLCDGWHEQAIAAGCDDCIVKPIDDNALGEILERFLHFEP